ncbi:carboxypeptidase Y-like [Octopus sinensis]|uniref:Carboxypeptidase Y-like n=1 Tax=Octopus sinensis TaxID=2607531 RepID=A0A6P7TTM3_9MOLL|nr:carboxypeptidase Y-like [Octopus sinensis]
MSVDHVAALDLWDSLYNKRPSDPLFSIRIHFNFENSSISLRNKDEPLILTNYLNEGNHKKAQRLSRIRSNVESYAGYFRVNDDCVRNMFFYYVPAEMVDYGRHLFNLGLIFDYQVSQFDSYRDMIRESIDRNDYKQAFEELNVGNQAFNDGKSVKLALAGDFMRSVTPLVQTILDNGYKCLFFNGQFNLLVPFQMTSEFLLKMVWSEKDAFLHSEQRIWYSRNTPEVVNGYVRSYKNLYHVLIRNAGHMAAVDQPQATLEMIDNFIFDRKF